MYVVSMWVLFDFVANKSVRRKAVKISSFILPTKYECFKSFSFHELETTIK